MCQEEKEALTQILLKRRVLRDMHKKNQPVLRQAGFDIKVEVRGVEPRSEKVNLQASTCLFAN